MSLYNRARNKPSDSLWPLNELAPIQTNKNEDEEEKSALGDEGLYAQSPSSLPGQQRPMIPSKFFFGSSKSRFLLMYIHLYRNFGTSKPNSCAFDSFLI